METAEVIEQRRLARMDKHQSDARRLIEKHGYWRRKEELEDAEAIIGRQP